MLHVTLRKTCLLIEASSKFPNDRDILLAERQVAETKEPFDRTN